MQLKIAQKEERIGFSDEYKNGFWAGFFTCLTIISITATAAVIIHDHINRPEFDSIIDKNLKIASVERIENAQN